jgi:hypothetical protein
VQPLRPRVAVPDSPLKEQYRYDIQSTRTVGDTSVYHHSDAVNGFATITETRPATASDRLTEPLPRLPTVVVARHTKAW